MSLHMHMLDDHLKVGCTTSSLIDTFAPLCSVQLLTSGAGGAWGHTGGAGEWLQHVDGAAPIDQGHPTEVGVGSGVCCCPLHVPP